MEYIVIAVILFLAAVGFIYLFATFCKWIGKLFARTSKKEAAFTSSGGDLDSDGENKVGNLGIDT